MNTILLKVQQYLDSVSKKPSKLDDKLVEEFGEEAEYPQVNVGFKHVGGLKETLKYVSDHGMLL